MQDLDGVPDFDEIDVYFRVGTESGLALFQRGQNRFGGSQVSQCGDGIAGFRLHVSFSEPSE